MNAAERYEFNKHLNYATTQIELKRAKVDSILDLDGTANFANPLAALGLAGTGLGALKGAVSQDPYGQPIGTGERLKRVAVNAAGGGALGLGGGALAKQFTPNILNAIDPAPVEGLRGLRNVLGSDIGDEAASVAQTNRQLQAKVAKEAADREAFRAAKQQEKILRKQAFRSNNENIAERFRGAVDDIIINQKTGRVAQAVQGGKANIQGASAVADQATRPIRKVVRNAAIDTVNTGREAGVQAKPIIKSAAESTVDAVGAGVEKAKPVFDRIWDKGRRDIEATRQLLNARNPQFSENYLKAARFGLFDAVPDNLSKPVIAGVGLGMGTGATLGAANAIGQNYNRTNREFNTIYGEPDPDKRVQAFDRYTSNPDKGLRGVGDASNVLGKTAIGAGVGALGGGLLVSGVKRYV